MKYHPDKNVGNEKKAGEMFKDVNEAFSVLSDKDKRGTYDRFGHAGLKGGIPGGGGAGGSGGMPGGFSFGNDDAFKVFESFFGGGGLGSMFGGGGGGGGSGPTFVSMGGGPGGM